MRGCFFIYDALQPLHVYKIFVRLVFFCFQSGRSEIITREFHFPRRFAGEKFYQNIPLSKE